MASGELKAAGEGRGREDERLSRDPERAVLAGVLAGLAGRIGIDPLLARVAFIVGVVASGGVLVVAYPIGWALMPSPGAGSTTERAFRPSRGGARARLAVGSGLLTLALLLAFRELGVWWSDALVWPLVLAASGAALLWRQSTLGGEQEPVERSLPGVERRRRRPNLYRGYFGVALVIGAALLFLAANDAFGAAREAALTTVVVAVALALILAPFLWRLGRRLAAERAERIRTEERAELGSHLHDSVLQTLTLMQKRATEPDQVVALARRQERELRSWLAGDRAPSAGSLAAALTGAAEGVEDAHRVEIEPVIVGDCELDERGAAIVAAAREALTNAAKFAGSPVSLYAEVGDQEIEAYVRDRGPGFDPAAVPEHRRGIRESIVGRMERIGGVAAVVPTPAGTEVQLRIPRSER